MSRLPKLVVEVARDAEFTRVVYVNRSAEVQRASLELLVGNVTPGCRLEILNLSANPGATWTRDALAIAAAVAVSGRVAIDTEECAIGILPGDVLAVRQVDAAGNASEPTRVDADRAGAARRR